MITYEETLKERIKEIDEKIIELENEREKLFSELDEEMGL
jgi:predicted  nucleic acid-binding Zn-ribbon protein